MNSHVKSKILHSIRKPLNLKFQMHGTNPKGICPSYPEPPQSCLVRASAVVSSSNSIPWHGPYKASMLSFPEYHWYCRFQNLDVGSKPTHRRSKSKAQLSVRGFQAFQALGYPVRGFGLHGSSPEKYPFALLLFLGYLIKPSSRKKGVPLLFGVYWGSLNPKPYLNLRDPTFLRTCTKKL